MLTRVFRAVPIWAGCMAVSVVGSTMIGGKSMPKAQAATGLELASVHAAVGDLDTGQVLYAKRADTSVPIASVTKLMTAMVVLDGKQSLGEWITIAARKNTYGKNGFSHLRPGSKATRGDLLRLTLMASENLAAYALALRYPGGVPAFVDAMNRKARELKMTRTHFDDPSGLSPANRASAADLLKMVAAASRYPTIREYTGNYSYRATFREPDYKLSYVNTNPLTASSRWSVDVSKTGYLVEAGRCLVMIAEIDGRPISMVFLNSFGTRTPIGDAGRVRRWLQTGNGGSIAAAARAYEASVVAK